MISVPRAFSISDPDCCCGGGSSSSSGSSGSASGGVPCCCDVGPDTTLYATISDVQTCGCADVVTVTLDQISYCHLNEADVSSWEGSAAFCGRTITLRLECKAGVNDARDWELTLSFDDNCSPEMTLRPDGDASCDAVDLCSDQIQLGLTCCGPPPRMAPPSVISICITE